MPNKLIALTLAIAVLVLVIYTYPSKTPDNIGLKEGRLSPCPSSPNCVSSTATDAEHAIAPIKASGTRAEVMDKLSRIISSMSGAKIIRIKGPYLHAELRSKVFRFVDDVEFYFDEGRHVLEVRSAARLGYSDFSVNRKRMERIRYLFTKSE